MVDENEHHRIVAKCAELECELRIIKKALHAYDYFGNDKGYDLDAFKRTVDNNEYTVMQSWKSCQNYSDSFIEMYVALLYLIRKQKKHGGHSPVLPFLMRYSESVRQAIRTGLRIHPRRGVFFGDEPALSEKMNIARKRCRVLLSEPDSE